MKKEIGKRHGLNKERQEVFKSLYPDGLAVIRKTMPDVRTLTDKQLIRLGGKLGVRFKDEVRKAACSEARIRHLEKKGVAMVVNSPERQEFIRSNYPSMGISILDEPELAGINASQLERFVNSEKISRVKRPKYQPVKADHSRDPVGQGVVISEASEAREKIRAESGLPSAASAWGY